jgi:hypothetical protein
LLVLGDKVVGVRDFHHQVHAVKLYSLGLQIQGQSWMDVGAVDDL